MKMLLRSKQPRDKAQPASERPVLTSKTSDNLLCKTSDNLPGKAKQHSKTKKRQHAGKNANQVSNADISLYFELDELGSVTRDFEEDEKENSVSGFTASPKSSFRSNQMVTSTPILGAKKFCRSILSYYKNPQPVSVYEGTDTDIYQFQQQNLRTYSGRVFVPNSARSRLRKRKTNKENMEADENNDIDEEEDQEHDDKDIVNHRTKKKKKPVEETKAFQEWAEKMNQELDLAESFELAVE